MSLKIFSKLRNIFKKYTNQYEKIELNIETILRTIKIIYHGEKMKNNK